MGLATRLLRIHEGEGRVAGLMVGLTFVSMTAFAIGESGIDALFFDRVGADALPVTYLLQGSASFIVMLALTGTLGRLGHRRAYLSTPLALGALLLAERALILTNGRWVFFLLWITAAIGTLLLGVSLWGVAGAVVDTRQAKRLFPIFAAGGILGSVIGGVSTRPLAQVLGAENLLLVWAGGLALAFFLSRLVLGPGTGSALRQVARRRVSALRDIAAAFAFVRRSRLLVWMTIAAVFFSILFFLLYLPYAQAASERFPKADELAGFFGLFWAGVTLAALLVSMVATNRLFAWLGVAAMVIVLPILYSAAFGVLLLTSGFVVLVVLRFALGTWLQGVASPGWETLTNVVPESRRDQTRAFLNGGPTQIGTIIAGLVAIIGQNALTVRQFALMGLAAAVLTILATIGIRRSYAGALGDALRAGRPQVFERPLMRQAPVGRDRCGFPAGALASDAIPGRSRAAAGVPVLGRSSGRNRPPELVDGVHDDDPLVRLAAIRALDVSTPRQERILSMMADPDTAVAAAAAARALALSDPVPHVTAPGVAERPGRTGETRHHRATRLAPPSGGTACRRGPRRPCTPVRAAALESVAAAAPDRILDRALADLRDPNPASASLPDGRLAREEEAVGEVLDALGDRQTADARRRPCVASSRTGRAIGSAHSSGPRPNERPTTAYRRLHPCRRTTRRTSPRRDPRPRSSRRPVGAVGRDVAQSPAGPDGDGDRKHRRRAGAGGHGARDPRNRGRSGAPPPALALWEPLPSPSGPRGLALPRPRCEDRVHQAMREFHPRQTRRRSHGNGFRSSNASSSCARCRCSATVAGGPRTCRPIGRGTWLRGRGGHRCRGRGGRGSHIVIEGMIRVVQGARVRNGKSRGEDAGDAVGEMSIIARRRGSRRSSPTAPSGRFASVIAMSRASCGSDQRSGWPRCAYWPTGSPRRRAERSELQRVLRE